MHASLPNRSNPSMSAHPTPREQNAALPSTVSPATPSCFPKAKLAAPLVAAFALWAAAPEALAQVVTYSGPPIAIPQSIDGLYINVVTGAVGSGGVAGWDVNVYSNSPALAFWAPATGGYVGSSNEVSLLTPGISIGPSNPFLTAPNIGGGYRSTAFQTGVVASFGISFLNEATGAIHYGWVDLSTGANAGFPASVLSYGYEATPGTPVTIITIPEPSTFALILSAVAAAGAFVFRRRRNA